MSNHAPTLFDKMDSWVVRILKWVSYVSAICLVGIMLVAFINVIGEKLRTNLGLPVTGIPGSTEIITYLHIPVVFLAASYVTLDRGHTKIDLLSAHFPHWLQQICTTIGNLVGAVICGVVSWRSFVLMQQHISRHMNSSTSSSFKFPLWPFSLITVIGFALLAVSFLWSIVRQYAKSNQTKPEGGES